MSFWSFCWVTGFQFYDPAIAKKKDKDDETESDLPPTSGKTYPCRSSRSQKVAAVTGTRKFSQITGTRLHSVLPCLSFTTIKKPLWTRSDPTEHFAFARVLQNQERSRTTSLKTDSSLSSDVEEPALLRFTPAYAVREPTPAPLPRPNSPPAHKILIPTVDALATGVLPPSSVQLDSHFPGPCRPFNTGCEKLCCHQRLRPQSLHRVSLL